MTGIDKNGMPRTNEVKTFFDFVDAINSVFGDPDQRDNVVKALKSHNSDLRSVLRDVTKQEIPPHVDDYLDYAKPYFPMLVAAAQCFGTGVAYTVQVAKDFPIDTQAPDIAVRMTDGNLVLTIRSIP
jgi:hypothetical protein